MNDDEIKKAFIEFFNVEKERLNKSSVDAIEIRIAVLEASVYEAKARLMAAEEELRERLQGR